MISFFRKKVNKIRSKSRNLGMTMVEMIVSFALLSILVTASTVIISNVTTLYYRVRGENYARQVSNILMTKITSEIAGAKYSKRNLSSNPKISADSQSIELYDRTNTKVVIKASDGILDVQYPAIVDTIDAENSRVGVEWEYDKRIYNGFEIEELKFSQPSKGKNAEIAAAYGLTDVNSSDYPDNVVAVYMKLKSPKYGEFSVYKYVRIYEATGEALDMESVE
jgi:prepilin-type N-terminal cleavage/methylation domain